MTATPKGKREYLRDASWFCSTWKCYAGEKRPPERWQPPGRRGRFYTLGEAFRLAKLTADASQA